MAKFTADQIAYLINNIKDARDIVRATIDGRLPTDIAFISALADHTNRIINVTEHSPAIIDSAVIKQDAEIIDKMRALGRNGVLLNLNDARDWQAGAMLKGGLGYFENPGLLPWPNTLRDASNRSRLANYVRNARLG